MSQMDNSYFYSLSDDVRMLFIVFCSTVMVIGVLGNVMVIVVILSTKEMRNSTNIFLANLAAADIMTLLTWGFRTLFNLKFKWQLEHTVDHSDEICAGMYFMWDAVAYVSVLTILAIGFERYNAICQPLKAVYMCTKKRACGICLLVWVFAALSSSPQFFFEYLLIDEACLRDADSLRLKAYRIISGPVLTFLPLIILVILFLIIFRNLRQAVAPNVNIAAMRHRHHVITMLATVILCFFLCHLPYRGLLFLGELIDINLSEENYNLILFLSLSMVFLHSALNPILYNLMSERFRTGFKNIICDTVHKLNSWFRSWCEHRELKNPTTTLVTISSNE